MSTESLIIPQWPAPPWVRAFSTTRTGGVSKGAFASLNLAQHVGDQRADVVKNRQILVNVAQLPAEPDWLEQVHGRQIINIDSSVDRRADAGFATKGNQVCVVMTADCLPILLCHQSQPTVAAVHVGWRGLAAGIIEASLNTLPGASSEYMAWLGPAIGPKKFEVGHDVFEALALCDDSKQCFTANRKGHWYADLYRLATLRLAQCGVSAVFSEDLCTSTDSERFFSYRRDGETGRMASLIWIAD